MWTIEADYHTHSAYSDGRAGIEENVRAAMQKGLRCIAVTEHGPWHLKAGVRRKRLAAIRREVDAMNERYGDRIRVLMGLEANLISLDGDVDVRESELKLFDMLLMGYHRSALGKSLYDNWFYLWRRRHNREVDRQVMTQAIVSAVQRYPLSILSHPGHHFPVDYAAVARACAQAGTAMELSARAGHLRLSAQDVRACKAAGAVFAIDSDAHRPEEIGGFDQAVAIAKQAGLTQQDIVNASGYAGALPRGLVCIP